MHDRLSVHSVTFLGTSVAEQQSHWAALGVRRLSLIDSQLAEPALPQLVEQNGYSVDTVYHLFASGDGLSRVIDSAAEVGARVVYMLTGGRGEKTWDRAAERLLRGGGAVRAPCRAGRRRIGHRERLGPVCRHSHRAYAAGHDHARGNGRGGYLHRLVPLLGRGGAS